MPRRQPITSMCFIVVFILDTVIGLGSGHEDPLAQSTRIDECYRLVVADRLVCYA